jgi:hypothetical protein
VRAKFPDAPPFALKFLDRWALFTPELPCAHLLSDPWCGPLERDAVTCGYMQTRCHAPAQPATNYNGHRHAQLASVFTRPLQALMGP